MALDDRAPCESAARASNIGDDSASNAPNGKKRGLAVKTRWGGLDRKLILCGAFVVTDIFTATRVAIGSMSVASNLDRASLDAYTMGQNTGRPGAEIKHDHTPAGPAGHGARYDFFSIISRQPAGGAVWPVPEAAGLLPALSARSLMRRHHGHGRRWTRKRSGADRLQTFE